MKASALVLSFLFASVYTNAQTPAALQGTPNLKILKYSWSKERIRWQQNPFDATLEGLMKCVVG